MARRGAERFLLATILGLGLAGLDAGPGRAASTTHLLAIGDTLDAKVGKSVISDLANLRQVFQANVDPRSIRVTELSGPNCHPANILAAVSALRPGPDDAVVVYFSGHGAYDDQAGPYLKFPRFNDPTLILKRSDFEAAVRAKLRDARLAVLLTDCCNRLSILPRKPKGMAPFFGTPGPGQEPVISPLFRALFFDCAGYVDLTSSKRDELSLCHPGKREGDKETFRGSLFTCALVDTLIHQSRAVLTWRQVADRTAEAVRVEFQRLKPDGQDNEDEPEKPQMTQTVVDRLDVSILRPTRGGEPSPPPGRERPDLGHISLGVAGFENKGKGIYVWSTQPAGPAARLGLERGDVILAIDDATIRTARGYVEALAGVHDGEAYLTFIDSRTNTVRSDSVATEYIPEMAPGRGADGRPAFGVSGEAAGGGGVVVRTIAADSPAALVGLDPGDIVRSVNGAAIGGPDSLDRAVADSPAEMWYVVKNSKNGEDLGMVVALDRPRGQGAGYSLGVDGFDSPGGGVSVWSAHPRSPAELLGLARGDVILTVGGRAVDSVPNYIEALKSSYGRVDLTWRPATGGPVRSASARLESIHDYGLIYLARPPSRFGASATQGGGGVVVRAVVPNTAAARVGLDPGDVILSINGRDVESDRDYQNAVLSSPVEMWFVVRNVKTGQPLAMVARLDQ